MKMFIKLVFFCAVISCAAHIVALDITTLVTPDQVRQMIGNVKEMVTVSGNGTIADVMIARISELPTAFGQGITQLQSVKALESAALAANLMKNPEIFLNLVISQLSRFNDPFVQQVAEFARSFRNIIVDILIELKPLIVVMAKALTELNTSAKIQGSITEESIQRFKNTLQEQLNMSDIAQHVRQKITENAELFNTMAQNLINL